jgi:hypothetical protein
MTPWTAVTHLAIAIAAVAGVCVLAAIHVLPASDAFTVIMSVLVGTGVVAGSVIANGPPAPTPPPTPPVAPLMFPNTGGVTP